MNQIGIVVAAVVIVALLAVGFAYFYFNPGSGAVATTTYKTSTTTTPGYTTTQTTTTTPTNITFTASSTTVIQTSGTVAFSVAEREYTITPNTFVASAGQTIVFNVTNYGSQWHDFGIYGLGSEYGTPQLNPGGGKGTFQFSASNPGNYTIYSNVDGDQGLGMVATLRIT